MPTQPSSAVHHPAHFIVIEGLDGAGTTTQVRKLAAWFQSKGQTSHTTCEPSGGPIGRMIRQVLKQERGAPDRKVLPWMFAADRSDHLNREIEPCLQSGTHVISDRYYHSSLAYQSMEIPLDEVHALNRTFRTPDLTIFVRIDVDTAMERIEARGGQLEIFERREQLEQIAVHYDQVLTFLRGLGEPIIEVDGSRPIEVVFDNICTAIEALETLGFVGAAELQGDLQHAPTKRPGAPIQVAVDVAAFHRAGEVPMPSSPGFPGLDRIDLRKRLIREEAIELFDAIEEGNMVEVVDGCIDLIYVTIGTLLELGVDPTPAWNEVQRSNMAKFPPCESCNTAGCKTCNGRGTQLLLREDGKVLKPEGWTPPNLGLVLLEQGYRGHLGD